MYFIVLAFVSTSSLQILHIKTSESGIFEQFGKMLKNNPELRCNTTEQCVDRVKSGSHVYVAVSHNHIYLLAVC